MTVTLATRVYYNDVGLGKISYIAIDELGLILIRS